MGWPFRHGLSNYNKNGCRCNICKSEKMANTRRYNLEHKKEKAEYGVKYRTENRKKIKQHDKERAKHPKRIIAMREQGNKYRLSEHGKLRMAGTHLKKTYGITLVEFDEMMNNQNGVCAICGKPELNGRRLSVDHDHTTGKVRNLLCMNCNNGIGMLQESTALLARAIEYLDGHK